MYVLDNQTNAMSISGTGDQTDYSALSMGFNDHHNEMKEWRYRVQCYYDILPDVLFSQFVNSSIGRYPHLDVRIRVSSRGRHRICRCRTIPQLTTTYQLTWSSQHTLQEEAEYWISHLSEYAGQDSQSETKQLEAQPVGVLFI